MREMGRFLSDVCPTLCPAYVSFGTTLSNEAELFHADVLTSLALTITRLPDGVRVFVPPIASMSYVPYHSMIESTVAMYSNFRYWSELLGADILPSDVSIGLQAFRESTQGTVSGITRWSDHLDDMPSSYYLAASLRDDRISRFLLLQYGHQANYMGRGTGTATEQLPITSDANGMFRDYLWSYLEGGIDECIPSIMLPAIATRWQFVLERYDTDVLWLGKGAPRRWAVPSGGGYHVTRAATRFGLVDAGWVNTPTAGGAESVSVTVHFTSVAVPGISVTPTFAIRVRSSYVGGEVIPSTVTVTGGAVLASVDAMAGLVWVNTTSGGEVHFSVAAEFTSP